MLKTYDGAPWGFFILIHGSGVPGTDGTSLNVHAVKSLEACRAVRLIRMVELRVEYTQDGRKLCHTPAAIDN